jgi:ankyrin repeat protein
MLRRNTIGAVAFGLAAALCSALVFSGSVTETRVADAAMHGDKDTVRDLLKQAVDVNAAQGDGMTALHWAALNGDAELAQTLIYAGANTRATTRLGGYTPLFMASKAGNSATIDVLLKAGADPKAPAVDGLTPLMMAAVSGDPKSVQSLLDHGADVNARESENGETAMSFAAALNRPGAIQVLLKNGADINYPTKLVIPPPPPARALLAAATTGSGAAPAPAPAGSRGQTGQTSGAAPAATQQVQQVNIADGVAQGGGNPKGKMTPLMLAARQGALDAAQLLVSSGANLNVESGDNSTALLLATINGHFDIAKFLVDHHADVNLQSMDGAAPLYGVVNTQWARKSMHPQPTTKNEKTFYLDLMTDLLDSGADPNAKLTKDLWYSEYNRTLNTTSAVGTTAFWKCAEVGDIDGMKLLVSRGADPKAADINGVTALLMASGAGVHGNDDVTTPYGRLASVKYLVEDLHLDVNAADKAPASNRGVNPQQLEYAIKQATDANNGKTPTQAQIDEQLKEIQQQGAFGRGRGGGITALHNAAARGDNQMILYLVAHGAKVNVVSNDGQTVVDAANGPRQRIQPYPETVALLEILGAVNNHKCVAC